MDIRIGKIDNISKKMIAGALILTLTFSSMVGTVVSKTVEQKREMYSNFEGIASFDRMKKCYFIGVMDSEGETKYYLAEKVESKSKNHTSFLYLDILSGKNVFTLSNPGIYNISDEQVLTMEINAGEYLSETSNKKDMYSVNDVNIIIDGLKVDNKKMIK